jgi:hypothetical protein
VRPLAPNIVWSTLAWSVRHTGGSSEPFKSVNINGKRKSKVKSTTICFPSVYLL